jgi:NADPH:quinone reductase-like Zn-dependent oxidoreductase
MRVWQVHELGEPAEVLRLEETQPPPPGPGEVGIEVSACALNFADVLRCDLLVPNATGQHTRAHRVILQNLFGHKTVYRRMQVK